VSENDVMQTPKILVLGNGVMDVVARPVDEVPRTGSVHPQTVTSYPDKME
jgi:hypothetical protein